MSNYLLSQVDIIGRKPELRINDMPRNQTLLGGSLCVIVYCAFILSSLYFGQELVYKVLPNIIESERITKEDDIINLSNDQFNLFFALNNKEYGFINPSQYLNLNLYMKIVNGNEINYKSITLGTCNEKDLENELNEDDSYKQYAVENFLCIKNLQDNFYIEGNNKYSKRTTIELAVNDCSNESCKSEEEIKKFLSNSTLSVFYFDTSLDFRKYQKFSKIIIRSFDITINSNFYKFIDVKLGITKIYTDIGYIFERFKTKQLHNIKTYHEYVFDHKEQTDLNLLIGFRLDYIKLHIYRKYYKIQNWVAELGGMIRAMTLIASLINYFNDKASFYELLINKLFDVDDIIKYFQFNDLFINKQSKRRKRDSIVLRNAKREKDYFEKGENRFMHNYSDKKFSPQQTNNYMYKKPNNKENIQNTVKDDNLGFMRNQNDNNKSKKKNNMNKINNNSNNNISNNVNINDNLLVNNSIISSNNDDEREIFIDNLKKNQMIKEHFEKVRSNRFSLSCCESFKFYFKNYKENPKFNSFIGGRELLRERTDLIYILKKNLELDRFKNLILKDNQLVLLNSLTRFMLDPERVNLLDFETCSYEKFIDCYDGVSLNSNMIDLKLAKWVETKFKFDQHNPSAL